MFVELAFFAAVGEGVVVLDGVWVRSVIEGLTHVWLAGYVEYLVVDAIADAVRELFAELLGAAFDGFRGEDEIGGATEGFVDSLEVGRFASLAVVGRVDVVLNGAVFGHCDASIVACLKHVGGNAFNAGVSGVVPLFAVCRQTRDCTAGGDPFFAVETTSVCGEVVAGFTFKTLSVFFELEAVSVGGCEVDADRVEIELSVAATLSVTEMVGGLADEAISGFILLDAVLCIRNDSAG